jgi:hypothetical protein
VAYSWQLISVPLIPDLLRGDDVTFALQLIVLRWFYFIRFLFIYMFWASGSVLYGMKRQGNG